MNTMSEPVETNTIKYLTKLFKENQFEILQRKMNVLRSKFYPADNDGSLSLKGIIVYEDQARNNLKMTE
jgi:hypothetical protein